MRSGDMARRAAGEGARSKAGLPWQEVQCCWNTAKPNSVPLRSGTAVAVSAALATAAASPSGKSHDHTVSFECALRSRIGAPRFVLAVTILHELPHHGAASCGHGRSAGIFRIAKT